MAAGLAPRAPHRGQGPARSESNSADVINSNDITSSAAAGRKMGRGSGHVTSQSGGRGGASGLLSTALRRLRDPRDTVAACAVAGCLLLFESLLCCAVLLKVPYTKIDWDAYMSQVEGFLGGERNYDNLKGDTGPLVYPAGFLYIFAALRWLTGGQVPQAQVLFLFLYLVNQAIVFSLYIKSKVVPPWALALLCVSKRLHSIFLLRLFNDCWAAMLMHASLLLMLGQRWRTAMLLFSAAVSVKMNVLLLAPPLLLLLLEGLTLWGTIGALACAAAVQIGLAAPFLATFPQEYLSQAFNLGRVFVHFWSVNFKFVQEDLFVSKPFALSLLALHLGLLFLFAHCKWCRSEGGVFGVLHSNLRRTFSADPTCAAPRLLAPDYILTTMFVGNFIGIVCARSLHYQFYSWYFHSLPFLLWLTPFPTALRLALFAAVEVCWNIYPSTPASSLVLLSVHLAILLGLALSRTPALLEPAGNQVKKDA